MISEITIIGAGIAGLTAALALQQKGCKVTIYESASEIKPVGAGIVMASNAMQIFKKLGIADKIQMAGNRISSMTITDERLSQISSVELSEFEMKYGVCNVAIHRAQLQKILAEEVGYDNIKLSKRLFKIEQSESIKLTFDDGTVEPCSALIGADGIKSIVRNQLFNPSIIRDVHQACWRGVADLYLPPKYRHNAIEAWGKGKRFGFVKIASGKVYWFAVANENLVKGNETNLLSLFNDFHSDIQEIVSATPMSNVIFSKLTDLKPIMKWHQDKVCLIGDAAHATTPNLGQGACQAVEDAYTLAQLYKRDSPIEHVFKEYEVLRIKKAHKIVNTSWTLGKVAHVENAFGVWLRNSLLRALPQKANTKQLDSIFNVEYIYNR
jgi:2-polyprenyl-6-methoxyphenol hydroxylase-like FAD-dependent oxidoreductase